MKTLKVALAAASAVVVGWALTASADIPASAYVQDGLVVQWDSLEKSGAEAPGNWTDLKRGDTIPLLSDDVVNADSIRISAESHPFECLKGCDFDFRQPMTLEVRAKSVTYTANKSYSIFNIKYRAGLQLDTRYAPTGGSCFNAAFPDGNGATLRLYYDNLKSLARTEAANYHTYSAASELSKTCTAYCDGSACTFAGGLKWTDTTNNYGTPDGTASLGSANGAIDYKSIRVYNRALEPEEIAWNARIDAYRFGDQAGSYRQNGETKELEGRMTIVAGAGGKVSIDGGELTDGAEVWFPLDTATDPLTLTAQQDAGQSFTRWVGDIGDADPYSPTISVKSVVGTVTAVFASYQRVDWIQLTGEQCLHTGYVPAKTDRVEMKVRFDDLSVDQCLFCSRKGNATDHTMTAFLIGSTRTMRFDSYNNASTSCGYEPPIDEDVTFWADYANASRVVRANGDQIQTLAANTSLSPVGPFVLFGSYANSSTTNAVSNFGKFRFYRFTVRNGSDVVKHDYVPVRNYAAELGTAAECGVLDLVTGAFIPLSGTAPAVCGDAVADGNGSLTIATDAPGLGGMTPTAGPVMLADGATVVCSAETTTDDAAGTRAVPVGYTLETYDLSTGTWSAPAYHAGTSYAHTQAGTAMTRLTWKWQRQVRVTATAVTRSGAAGSGTVKLGDGEAAAEASVWCDLGASVPLVATPATGYTFGRWEGEIRDNLWIEEIETTVTADKPRAVLARFHSDDEYWELDGTSKILRNTLSGCELNVSLANGTTNLTFSSLKTVPDGWDGIIDLTIKACSQDRQTGYAVTTIASQFLNSRTEVTELHLPDSVTVSTYYGMTGASNLKVFRMPKYLTTLGVRFFQGCSKLVNVYGGRLCPETVTTLNGAAFYGIGHKGPIYFSNPAITTLPTEFLRGSKALDVDFTGTSIGTISANGTIFCNAASVQNTTWPPTLKLLSSSAESLCSSSGRRVRFRGDPPVVSTTSPFGASTYLAIYAPKWNKTWEQYLADQTDCTVSEMTADDCRNFVIGHPGEAMPLCKVQMGNLGTARPITWWYPDEPPTYEDLSLFDVLGYDQQKPVVSEGDAAIFDGTFYTWNSQQAQLRWTGAEGHAVTIEIPEAAETARSVKLTKYRVHQPCLGAMPNGRAPTAWTLYGKLLDSDEWTLIDSVEMTGATTHWRYFDWQDYAETVPDYGDCARTFELAVDKQNCYKAFKFVPSASYNTAQSVADETPYALMELELIGQLTTPQPEVSSFAVSVPQWNSIAFSGTVSGLGEIPARRIYASQAWAWVEVAADEDFEELVSSTEPAEVTAGVAKTYTVNGLTGNTGYFARFVVSNDLESVTVVPLAGGVATLEEPFVCARPAYAVDEEGNATVTFDVDAYYAAAAGTVTLYIGTSPGGEFVQDGAAQSVSAAGQKTFPVSLPASGDTACVKVVVTADGVTRSYVSGMIPFWIANAETNPTLISNAVYDIAFKVTADKNSTNLTLGAFITGAAEPVIDLSTPISSPTTNRFALVSMGTTFRENLKIEEVIMPDTVTTIPGSSFYACSKLRKVRFSANLKTIGDNAFENCKQLVDVEPFLPSTVTSVGASAFDTCTSLQELTIPAGLAGMGSYQFHDCSGLRVIRFAERGDNTFAFGNQLFANCSSLTNIEPRLFPKNTTFTTRSFNYCSKLAGDAIFEVAGKLSFGEQTLNGCSKITALDFSRCGNVSFDGNSPLTSMGAVTNIVFPVGFTNFQDRSCIPMGGPTRIQFLGPPPTLGATAPISTTGKYLITVPNAGTLGEAWRQYLADNPDWMRPMTSAERTALRTQFPGVKGVKGMVNLGGICGWHYLQRTPGDGLLLFVR